MSVKRANWARGVALVCVAVLAAGCSSGDDSTGPSGPGQLTVNVSSTGSSGTAFLITLTGADITNPVAANSSHRIYSVASDNTVKVAVIGSFTSGDLLRFSVPDVGQADSYSARLDQVAGADNTLKAVGDFTLTVTR